MGMMIEGECGCFLCDKDFKDGEDIAHIVTGRVDFPNESIEYDAYGDEFLCAECYSKVWKALSKKGG